MLSLSQMQYWQVNSGFIDIYRLQIGNGNYCWKSLQGILRTVQKKKPDVNR